MNATLWKAPLNECAALGLKVCAVNRAGEWLAVTGWEGQFLGDMTGSRWQEFVEPADLPELLAWFAEDGVGTSVLCEDVVANPVHFEAMIRTADGPAMACLTMVKAWAGDAWLCYGAVRRELTPELVA